MHTHDTPPDGWTIPGRARALRDRAERHGWDTAVTWGWNDLDPYVTVAMRRDGAEYRATWAAVGDAPRMRLSRILGRSDRAHDWGMGYLLRQIDAIIEAAA